MTPVMPQAAFMHTGACTLPEVTGTGTAPTGENPRGWVTVAVSGERQRIEKFLEAVYKLAELGDLQGATDEIFETVDQLLLDEKFGYCNKIVSRIDLHRLPTALMRSFLTITAAAKDKLPARRTFYEQVLKEMIRLKGNEKAQRLLGQLA